MSRHVRSRVVLVALCAMALGGLAACSEEDPTVGAGTTSSSAPDAASDPTPTECAAEASIVECAPDGTMLDAYIPPSPEEAEGEPIVLGTINQDTGAAGAFPELTTASQVAIEFINTELGGVEGRPIELVTCDTQFNPAQSQACAQRMVDEDVVAVVGGIDVFGDGIATLEDNGIPYVGGIPVSELAMTSDVSFQFSGGTWGAMLGFAKYAATELDAKRVSIIYGDFPPIADSAGYGERALKNLGVDVKMVKTPVMGADWVAALNEAAQSEPDTIIALTADTGCVPAMQTAKNLDIDAHLLVTGACAAPKITAAAGDAALGVIYNLEAELSGDNPDNALYDAIASKYGEPVGYEGQSAGTVSFRSMMNLYVAMREIGADNLTPEAIIEHFRAAEDAPSFFGHPYTCDGKQLEGKPATCSPQQTLGRIEDGTVVPVSGWIEVSGLV